jgi:hypothetical protein
MALILVSNLGWKTDIVTEISLGFNSSLQRNSMMVPGLGNGCLLPNLELRRRAFSINTHKNRNLQFRQQTKDIKNNHFL